MKHFLEFDNLNKNCTTLSVSGNKEFEFNIDRNLLVFLVDLSNLDHSNTTSLFLQAQINAILGLKKESSENLLKVVERQLEWKFINKKEGKMIKNKEIIQHLMQLSE